MKKENVKIQKQNMKIYSLYRMLSFDHIFYHAIDLMFLIQVKNLTASDVVLGQTFFALFIIFLQIPIIVFIDKIGKKNATIFANIFFAIFILLIINCENIGVLIFAQFIDAIGFSIKNTSDVSLLRKSIPETSKSGEIFSKIEGRGLKNYYFFAAITAVLGGILYGINPYVPLVFSFILSILSAVIALGFEETDEIKNSLEIKNASLYITELKHSFKFILQSSRLKALLLYSGIIWSMFCLITVYVNSLLKDIGATALAIACMSAVKEISLGIGSKKQLLFHNKFRNKSLTIILVITSISVLIMGIIGMIGNNIYISMSIIAFAFMWINLMRGINGVLSVRYLQNFTDDKILPRIYAVNSISQNLFRVIIGFIGSYLLTITNTANAIIIIWIMFAIIITGLITYMKTRVGLKPEEYKLDDIEFK